MFQLQKNQIQDLITKSKIQSSNFKNLKKSKLIFSKFKNDISKFKNSKCKIKKIKIQKSKSKVQISKIQNFKN